MSNPHAALAAHFVRTYLFAATLSVVAGCVSYHPKPLDAVAEHTAFDARRLNATPSGSVDLATLTETALRFHPEIEAAVSRRRVAEAAVTAAGARPNPTLSTLVQKNRDPAPGESPWTYGFGLEIPIETAGKRDYRLEQARLRVRAAALREADVRWQVRSRVRDALIAAYPMVELARSRLAIQRDFTQALERRLEAGLVGLPEVLQARLALSQAALAVEETQRRHVEAQARLASAVGVTVKAIDGKILSFDGLLHRSEGITPPDIQRQALFTRPDVLTALTDYEASQVDLQLAVARQYPDFSLGPGYAWDAGAVKWSLALALALPLMNRNEGPIAEAEARREEAAASFRAVQAKAIGETEEALASYRQAARLLETATQIRDDQLRRQRSVQAAFRAGEENRLTLLAAQLETATAESARMDAQLEAWRAAGRLEDALRKPLEKQESDSTGEKQP